MIKVANLQAAADGHHVAAGGLVWREPVREMGLHRRPLAVENAVYAGVAQRAIARDLVLPQYPVQSCAQAFDGGAALLIEKVSAKFHGDAVELLERVAQEQQLALGVERAALHALAIPCRADLDA